MTNDASGIPCMMMRGGTSKGAYFLAEDMPADRDARDDLLLRIMGSPDPRQIDGIGGANRQTSKAAIVRRSADREADVDYLFLQIQLSEATVTTQQTCGNILAGVAPFAIERGLVPVLSDRTDVRIRVLNDGGLVVATVETPDGRVRYAGDAMISGVPFPAAPTPLRIVPGDKAVLPSGQARDVCGGVEVTCVNAGKPFVLVRAADLDVTGYEDPDELGRNGALLDRLEAIRRDAGRLMGLGDVSDKETPKLAIVSAARDGGAICARVFTPHTCHASMGLLAAVSIAAGLRIEGSIATSSYPLTATGPINIEHPAGYFSVELELKGSAVGQVVGRLGVLQTARKLFDGRVWPREA
jgi:4-oxalomesaconate tautomerase